MAAGGCDLETLLVRFGPAERVEARSGLRVDPDGPLSAVDPDLLVVPAGGRNDGDIGVRRECERAI